MAIKAVTFDAYGTLLRNEHLIRIPRAIVADHDLPVRSEDLWRRWIDLYLDATQARPFQTLRAIQRSALTRVLREHGVDADATPYVDLFFDVTTNVELYSETLDVLNSLSDVRSGIVSNADAEHVAAWTFTLPVEFIVISERVQAYKPDPLMFTRALEQFGGLQPHEVVHVGDSEVDDVKGAKAVGMRVVWVNRDGRPRLTDVPEPDCEVRDLAELPGLIRRLQ
jgi:2-haloalkanoic acid dehalogenase type II